MENGKFRLGGETYDQENPFCSSCHDHGAQHGGQQLCGVGKTGQGDIFHQLHPVHYQQLDFHHLRSSQAYDLCQTYLKNDTLALRMHNTFLSGLRAANSRITVDISGYSENEVYTAFQTSLQMIFDEHPEIFWLDPSLQNVVITSDHDTLIFYPRPAAGYGTASSDGTTASTINTTAIQNTLTKMNNMVSKMTGSTRYELVKSIHDTIVNNTQYPADPDNASHNNHQAVGPLVEGEAVCDGYAKAFKYACDQKESPA